MSQSEKVTKLLAAIDSAEATSYSSENSSILGQQRAEAISAYLGDSSRIPVDSGMSSQVSRDVFDTVESIKPSLMRIFSGDDALCRFTPVGPEDEDAAQQESDYINYLITQRNPWYQICNDWFTDALVTKNGYALGYWDTTQETETTLYEDQSIEQLTLQNQDPEAEVVEVTPKPTGQMIQDPQTGQVTPETLYDFRVRYTREKGHLCLKVLPPERIKVAESTPDFTLGECPYFEYWENKTISSIRAMGFDVDDDVLSSIEHGVATPEDNARDNYAESFTDKEYATTEDPSLRMLRLRMIWIRYDFDGDGIAELQYILRIGSNTQPETMLYRSECSRIPVASLSTIPLPHRHIGLSMADVSLDIQDIKTMVLRQAIDNLFRVNNARTAVSDKVNLDDMLSSRPGGLVRVRDGALPANEIMAMPIPPIFPEAMQALEYLDQVRENRTGTSRYFTGVDQNSLNKTASGISQLTSSAAQRVESIARTFAYAIEYLFSIAHEVVLRHGRKKDVVRLRNKWVDVDPSQWRSRTDVRISVGVGAGSKDQLFSHLQGIVDRQGQVLPLGITDPEKIYNALSEMTKISGFANPDKFWKDPTINPPPQQGPPPELMLKQQELQQKAQADQQDGQISMADLQLKEKIAMMEAQLEREKMAMQMQLEQQKIAHQKEIDTIKLAMDAQSNTHQQDNQTRDMAFRHSTTPEAMQPHIDQIMQQHGQQLEGIAAAMEAIGNHLATVGGKKTFSIERGGDGKATKAVVMHSDGSKKEVQLLRDKNKRLIGGEITTIQ